MLDEFETEIVKWFENNNYEYHHSTTHTNPSREIDTENQSKQEIYEVLRYKCISNVLFNI